MTDVTFLFLVVIIAVFADEVFTVKTLNFLVEDEEKSTEASHTTILIKILLFGQDFSFCVLLLDFFFNFTENRKNKGFLVEA